MDFMHILGQKEATWNTIFSIFERRRAPKRRGARENFPPFPAPLDGPEYLYTLNTLYTMNTDIEAGIGLL